MYNVHVLAHVLPRLADNVGLNIDCCQAVLSVTVMFPGSLPTPVFDDFQHIIWRVKVWEISSCSGDMMYVLHGEHTVPNKDS